MGEIPNAGTTWTPYLRDWYRDFYKGAGDDQDVFPWTKDADRDASFLASVARLGKGARVLDLGCGSGAHAIALAKQGLQVTAQDGLGELLVTAKRRAEEARVKVEFVQAAISDIPQRDHYDLVASIYCGGLCCLPGEPERAHALTQVAASLKPSGKFVLGEAHAFYALSRLSGRSWTRIGDHTVLEENQYEPLTGRILCRAKIVTPDGKTHERVSSQKFFMPSELVHLMQENGLRFLKLFGGYAEDAPFRLDRPDMVLLAEKMPKDHPGGVRRIG
ncbi:MAG: class I SAM-dependent methyltransferase [Planctomycetales bacterium]|nr:class I SAM-dependent methyltransferase [Planctomycetales bacterium]